MHDNEMILAPNFRYPSRPPIKWVVVVAILSAVVGLTGAVFADRLLQEHSEVKSEVRIDNLEARQREMTVLLSEITSTTVTKDELHASIHGIETRLDDMRAIMIELRSRR